MIAYKFLERGARDILTGVKWPVPAEGAPGAWVQGTKGAPITASHTKDLGWWATDELFRVELDGELREAPTQLYAARGRLIARVEAWTPALVTEFMHVCLHRVRDFAVEELRAKGEDLNAEALSRGNTIAELQQLSGSLAISDALARDLVGYVADACRFALRPSMTCTSLAQTTAAVAKSTLLQSFADERAWQSRWITQRLGL
ncbi:MAG: hypothetical protein JST92_24835 [Deltaproteobacteria bacterium]|nr:hypothetical protein [Deltaproteobacteria bacterium]